MTSREEIERQLTDWAANSARRDGLVSAALVAGVTPNRIHTLTGIARTTIYRIKENEMTEATHRRFVIRVAEHEAADPAWRVRHAADTIAIVLAYFESDDSGEPVQADDGTFTVHATSRNTLGTLRQMLVDHEGLTIVSEDDAPGNGIIVAHQA